VTDAAAALRAARDQFSSKRTALHGIRAAQKDAGPALDPIKFRALVETLGMDPNWSAEAAEALQCGVESDMIRLLQNSDLVTISRGYGQGSFEVCVKSVDVDLAWSLEGSLGSPSKFKASSWSQVIVTRVMQCRSQSL
jgi:hypothetical protein